VPWRIDDALMHAHSLGALLIERDAVRAVEIAEQWARRAELEERIASLICALAVQALARCACGQLGEAALSISRALEHAQSRGVIQPILSHAAFGISEPLKHLVLIDPTSRAASLAQTLAGRARGAGARGEESPDPDPQGLSAREVAVLAGIRRGDSNKVIARALRISQNTVKFHVKNVFRKLGISTRAEARTT
jgi:LuxR family maltose regulon positive regulatory protein